MKLKFHKWCHAGETMDHIHLETVDSTNVYAKAHAKEFNQDQITCITANYQTAGHGRHQRAWIAPKNVNLNITFYFTLPENTPHLISLSQIMAYSLAKVLEQNGLKPTIKWPNDIQLNGKKLAGILTETQFQKDLAELFIGVGINVNLGLETAQTIDQPATSLFIETGKKWDKKNLLKDLQEEFEKNLEIFKHKGFVPFLKEFSSYLNLLGKEITYFDGKKEWTGVFHSLSEEGQLNLLLSNGKIHTVYSGEISPK